MDASAKATQPVLHALGYAVGQDTRLGPTKELLDAKAAASGGIKVKHMTNMTTARWSPSFSSALSHFHDTVGSAAVPSARV